jgi:hypothetical protein
VHAGFLLRILSQAYLDLTAIAVWALGALAFDLFRHWLAKQAPELANVSAIVEVTADIVIGIGVLLFLISEIRELASRLLSRAD